MRGRYDFFMKTAVVIFTFPRDFDLAKRAAASVRDNWTRTGFETPTVFFVVHAKDLDAARSALPKEQILTHRFNAGGTLRYSEAIHGMRGIYRSIFAAPEKFDALLKVDSDTILLRPECFTNPLRDSGCGFVAVRRYAVDSTTLGNAAKDKPVPNLCNGCVYLLARDAFAAIDSCPPAAIDAAIHVANGHEDLFFSRVATAHDAVVFSLIDKRLAVFDLDKQTRNEQTVYIHCPVAEKGTGK